MNLTITAKESQGIAVLGLSGNIVLGEECDSLRRHLTQLLGADKKQIVLDLTGVRRVDSSGIGILVEAVVLASKEGGRLKLCCVPQLIYRTLSLHRLVQAFEIFNTEDEALASFG